MIDRHHVLYNRRAWEANDDLRHLRNSKQLIVPLERSVHNELHKTVSHVPPLSYHIARRALYTFIDTQTDDPIRAIENVQRSIEEAALYPRADIIERRVAETAIFALQLQKPFIRENLPTTIIDLGSYRENRRRPREFYDDGQG